MGFGVATLIDPATRAYAPLLGTFLNLLAVVIFFAIDGHHLLIRGLAHSFELVPLGVPLTEFNIAAVITHFGSMFVYAAAIAAPVVVSLFLLDVALGVVARTMPQVNVFIVSIPLKIFIGLAVFALSLQFMTPLMKNMFESIFRYWEKILT
jgi:flagellar biosynthetic protein FliR